MTLGETSTSESPTEISPRQTSGSRAPDGRPRSRCGSGRVDRRAWRIRYASAGPTVATYISLPRTTATPIPIGPLPSVALRPSRSSLVGEPLVGRGDRLLEADADPGRLVVVVLVADRLGGQPGRLEARGATRSARSRAGRDGPSSARRNRRSARRRRACRASWSSRSCSATTPSFICSRTAIRASRDRAGSRRVGAADDGRGRPGWLARRAARSRPGGGWQVRGLYAGTPAPDVDPQLARAEPARSRREGGQQLARAEPELLADDRRVGLDDRARSPRAG